MRSRGLYIVSLAAILLWSENRSANAQLLENRMTFEAGYGIGSFHGDALTSNGDFQYPGFYTNMKQLHGTGLSLFVNTGTWLDIGLDIRQLSASGWRAPDANLYYGAEAMLTSLGPIIRFSTPQMLDGILEKIRIRTTVSPLLGISKTVLLLPINTTYPELTNTDPLLMSADRFYGVEGGIGIDLIISPSIGTYLKYSLGYHQIGAVLFNDSSFLYSLVEVGLRVGFMKDKKFLLR